MALQSRPTRYLAVVFVAMFAIYLLIIGYGATLQDHRAPEVQTLAKLNRYLKDIGSPVSAQVNSCVRGDVDTNEKRMGVSFFVMCSVENIKGRGRIVLSAAFGTRNQVEYSDISEMKQ